MKTRIHPETGEILYRDVRPVEYTYKGESIIVDQPGWFPADKNDDNGILSQEDAKATDYVLEILKARYQATHENNLQIDNAALA